MFGVLLWKEIRDHLMTFRFGAALVTTFVLVLISVWVLGDDFVSRRDSYNVLAEQYAQETANVQVPSQISPKVGHPPSTLGIFAQGEERRFGNFVEIQRWRVPERAEESLSNNELLESVATFDLLTVFVVVVSLFGVLMSYDSISGERERGTLKLICTGPLRRTSIFASKFIGTTLVLALPFLLSFVSALIVLQFVHNIVFSSSHWMAISLMVLSGLIYGSLFIAVGMLCSALSQRSSTALLVALLIWTIAVFLVPLGGARLAEALQPLDSTANISAFEDEETRQRARQSSQFWNDQFQDDGYYSFYHTNISISGSNQRIFDATPDGFRIAIAFSKFKESLWRPLAYQLWNRIREHEGRKVEQAALATMLSSPSPAHHLQVVFTSLAGTSYSANARFMESARRYRTAMLDNFDRKGYFGDNALHFFTRQPYEEAFEEGGFDARMEEYTRRRELEGRGWFDRYGTRNFDEVGSLPNDLVPPFNYAGDSPDFEASLWPIGVLTSQVFLILAIGFIAFIRYDVR